MIQNIGPKATAEPFRVKRWNILDGLSQSPDLSSTEQSSPGGTPDKKRRDTPQRIGAGAGWLEALREHHQGRYKATADVSGSKTSSSVILFDFTCICPISFCNAKIWHCVFTGLLLPVPSILMWTYSHYSWDLVLEFSIHYSISDWMCYNAEPEEQKMCNCQNTLWPGM